jgi:DNA-binding transcriptional LysR family regulator
MTATTIKANDVSTLCNSVSLRILLFLILASTATTPEGLNASLTCGNRALPASRINGLTHPLSGLGCSAERCANDKSPAFYILVQIKQTSTVDRFKQLETFVAVALKGTMTAAARAEGVAPAIIGRRLDALEERLAVKLMLRSTRSITLTNEGLAFLEAAQRILQELASAEDGVSLGGMRPTGNLRITAPAGFGRVHVAPLVPLFVNTYPELSVSLDLTDRITDIVSEGFDLAVRIGVPEDSNMVGIKLADNRRVVVASPHYLKHKGTPVHPQELAQHDCLTFGAGANQARGWLFAIDGEENAIRVSGPLECNDGAVLHEWALLGYGLAWRSMWEVAQDLADGRLIEVLQEFTAPANAIYALVPQRKHMPLRVRVLIDFLKHHYAQQTFSPQSGT